MNPSNRAVNMRKGKSRSITARSFSSISLNRDNDFKSSKSRDSLQSKTQIQRTNSLSAQISKNTTAKKSNSSSLNEKSIFATAKQNSESKIQFKLSYENNIIENNPLFVKDLPLTE